MSDIIELAEHWERGGTVENPKALLRELIAELKAARAETERLREFEWMYKELQ